MSSKLSDSDESSDYSSQVTKNTYEIDFYIKSHLLYKYYFYIIRKWKSDSSNYDSETDKEEVPRSKSLAALRRQKQPVKRPAIKVNSRYKKKNSFSANSDDEHYGKSR